MYEDMFSGLYLGLMNDSSASQKTVLVFLLTIASYGKNKLASLICVTPTYSGLRDDPTAYRRRCWWVLPERSFSLSTGFKKLPLNLQISTNDPSASQKMLLVRPSPFRGCGAAGSKDDFSAQPRGSACSLTLGCASLAFLGLQSTSLTCRGSKTTAPHDRRRCWYL